jgi:hypothetical protein
LRAQNYKKKTYKKEKAWLNKFIQPKNSLKCKDTKKTETNKILLTAFDLRKKSLK